MGTDTLNAATTNEKFLHILLILILPLTLKVELILIILERAIQASVVHFSFI